MEFSIFLPIVFILYWLITKKNLKIQNLLLEENELDVFDYNNITVSDNDYGDGDHLNYYGAEVFLIFLRELKILEMK